MGFNGAFMSILSFLTVLEFTQSALYFPRLNLKQTYNKKVPSNFSDLVKYQVDGAHVFQTYDQGIFNHIYLTETKTYQNIYFNTSDLNSTLFNLTLIDYDYEGYSLHFLVSSNQVCIISPEFKKETRRINITEIAIQNNSLIQATNESYYIINPGSQNQTAAIYKYYRPDKTLNETKIMDNAQKNNMNATFKDFDTILQAFSGVKGETIRAKVCRKWFSYDDFLVLWNEYSYIEVWTCDYWECQKRWELNNDIDNETWVAGDVNWGPGCDNLYVEYDGYQAAMAYDEITRKILRNYTIDETVFDFQTIGSSPDSHAGLLLSNNTLVLMTPKGVIEQTYTNFSSITPESRYSQSARRLLINDKNKIMTYKFECWAMTFYNYWWGRCDDCSKTCDGCNEDNGKCIKCVEGLVKNMSNQKQCIPPNPPNEIKANETVITVIPEIVAPAQNLTNNKTITASFQQKVTQVQVYGAHYNYEQNVAKGIIQSFDVIGPTIEVLFSIPSRAPLAWLFLNFMNYWSICTYYLFLDAHIPQYLQDILMTIYSRINDSPFEIFEDLSQKIYPLNQKLESLNEKYGISSSFIAMNLQNFFTLICCTVLLKVFSYSLNFTSQTNWFRIKFQKQINIDNIIASQFVSVASSFILPFSLISTNLNFSTFAQIPNLLFHISFIGFALIFPFFVMEKTKKVQIFKSSIFTKKKVTVVTLKQKKDEQKSSLFETIEWIYVSNCNTILPFLCVLGMPGVFYFIGFGYFSFGVWLSRKITGKNINDQLLTLHPLLFHIFYTIATVFGQKSIFIKHHGSMICSIILMVGAVHELLTAFWLIIYFIVRQIIKVCKRSKTAAEQQLQEKNGVEDYEKSMNKLVKRTRFKQSIAQYDDEGREKATKAQKRYSTSNDRKQQKSTDLAMLTNFKTSSELMNRISINQQTHVQTPVQDRFSVKKCTNLTEMMVSLSSREQKKGFTHRKIKVHKMREKKEVFNCIEAGKQPSGSESMSSL